MISPPCVVLIRLQLLIRLVSIPHVFFFFLPKRLIFSKSLALLSRDFTAVCFGKNNSSNRFKADVQRVSEFA